MFENESQSYYEILDISSDAGQNEIRQAYFRAKAAYGKDSPALYSLFDEHQTRQMLDTIEQAYLVLSNPDKRKEYDRVHGFISEGEAVAMPATPVTVAAVALVAAPPPALARTERQQEEYASANSEFSTRENKLGLIRRIDLSKPYERKPVVEEEIVRETDFRGDFFRKIREYKGVSIEELSDFTKISRTYLNCIESEEFESLPAPAYLRGFILQIAKALKLPHDKAATAYMAHYKSAVLK